jgi:hypothetical protein
MNSCEWWSGLCWFRFISSMQRAGRWWTPRSVTVFRLLLMPRPLLLRSFAAAFWMALRSPMMVRCARTWHNQILYVYEHYSIHTLVLELFKSTYTYVSHHSYLNLFRKSSYFFKKLFPEDDYCLNALSVPLPCSPPPDGCTAPYSCTLLSRTLKIQKKLKNNLSKSVLCPLIILAQLGQGQFLSINLHVHGQVHQLVGGAEGLPRPLT